MVSEQVALLTFGLADARFAVSALAVQEVIHAVAVAPLPGAPAIVDGVVNLRGTIVPVVDLASRFGMPGGPVRPDQHFVVAVAGTRLVALRVRRTLDVVTVPAGTIEAAERNVPPAVYVAGVAKLADGLLVIHDLERLLSAAEGEQLDTALAEVARTARHEERDRRSARGGEG